MKQKAFKISFSFSLLFAICLSSCEGGRFASGVIIDSQTHIGIDSVQVESFVREVTNKPRSISFTDTSGKYNASTGMVGAGFNGVPSLFVRFSKSGYKTIVLENPNLDTILLEQ